MWWAYSLFHHSVLKYVIKVHFKIWCSISKIILFFSEIDPSNDQITSWGYCVSDCPSEELVPACLSPPPLPTFARPDTEQVNFNSSWFQIEGGEGTWLVLASTKERQHQPEWVYDAANITDDIKLNVSIDMLTADDLIDLYEIHVNGSRASYSCPLGYVFRNTSNITQVALCSNWTWEFTFNTTLPCERKLI